MEISFKKNNGRLDELIDEILSMADVHHPGIIREMVISALKTGQENDCIGNFREMIRFNHHEVDFQVGLVLEIFLILEHEKEKQPEYDNPDRDFELSHEWSPLRSVSEFL